MPEWLRVIFYLLLRPLVIGIVFIIEFSQTIEEELQNGKMRIGGTTNQIRNKNLEHLHWDYKTSKIDYNDISEEIYDYLLDKSVTNCRYNTCYKYHPIHNKFPDDESYQFLCHKKVKICTKKCYHFKEKSFLDKFIIRTNPKISYNNFVSSNKRYDILRFKRNNNFDISEFSEETQEFFKDRKNQRKKIRMEERLGKD
jgi:hypothetical protein